MNKLGIIGVSLVAAASMGGGMLLTGTASASSTRNLGTVQADPAGDGGERCVRIDSAISEMPEGGIDLGDVGEPVNIVEMDPGSTWQSVSIDAEGNVTTDQGTDANMPTTVEADATHTVSEESDSSNGADIVSLPDSDIHVGESCSQ